MNRTTCLAAILMVLAAGCTQKFKKTKSSLEYKIISGNGDKAIKYGDAVKFTAVGYYKDSLIATPYDTLAQFVDVDSTKLPPDYLNIFKLAKKGDSIVTRILVDSAMKYGQVPPFAKKGQYLGFRIKIIDVTSDRALANAQKQEGMKIAMGIDSMQKIKQKATDDKILTDLITKQNINVQKTAKGVYVEIKNPGQGELIDSGKVVTVDYKGMTLSGKIFDQSYDANGKSIKPFTFPVGQHQAIEGWDDGIKMFKNGGEGRLFIPSSLAYGTRGAGADILPNTPLVFEIKVDKVISSAEYKKQMEAQQKLQPHQPQGMGQGQPNGQPNSQSNGQSQNGQQH